MTNAPVRRLKTYRSPGQMPGLRRYGIRKSGLTCFTHALQARTHKRSSSASGSPRSANRVHSDCLAFAGILRRDRSAVVLFLRTTQAGSVRMPCSAAALTRHSAVNDPTWVRTHECGLGNSRLPGHVFQSTPLARRIWKRLHLDPMHRISRKGEASTSQALVTQLGPSHVHGVESPLRLLDVRSALNCFWSLPWLPFTAVTPVGPLRAPDPTWVRSRMAIPLAPTRAFRLTQLGSGQVTSEPRLRGIRARASSYRNGGAP